MPGSAPRLTFTKETLANGLELILHEDHRLPLVAVNVWYHVGPADEAAGLTGFAHLFEHLMFQGSGHVPEDGHFALLEAAGASLVNGTTDFDRTNYMEDVPADQLELALWLEADRMGFLLDRLDGRQLANQQDVVRNERRQTIENAPYGLVEEALWRALFPAGHPYRARVMGSHADIQAARLADVRDFCRRYYCPANASLCLAGDFEPDRARALVARYFGGLPGGARGARPAAAPPPPASARRLVMTDRVELPRVYGAWITPPIFAPGDAAADVAARILGGGKASRLYRRLVHDLQIAQSAAAAQVSLRLGSVFEIVATGRPDADVERLEREIAGEVGRLAETGPDDDELAGAVRAVRAAIVTSLERPGGFGGVADRLNLYNHHLGDPDRLGWDLARYDALTPADVRDFVRAHLPAERRVTLHALPGERPATDDPPAPAAAPPDDDTPAPADREPWRAAVPPRAARPPRPLPAARRLALPGGLTLLVLPRHDLPVVAVGLFARAGSAADPPGLAGLAGFTAAMLDEGTATRDALSLARELENLGATLATGAGEDGSSVVGRALRESASELLALIADVVLAPAFPPAEIERVRQERLTALRQQKDQPLRTALRALAGALYGEAHPYGRPPLGLDEALRAVGRDDLTGFWRAAFAPERAVLVLAGDLDEEEARALAQRALGAWRGAGGAQADDPAPRPLPERLAVVDRPGAPQTTVLVGQVGLPGGHPDHEALALMNQVLGGLFTSRVNLNLREDKGWTYGAFSALTERRGAGPLVVGATVQADAAGGAVRELLREIDGMLARPLTDAELDLARDSLARSLPALFESSGDVVGTCGGLFLQDRPPDHYEGLPARLAALAPADVWAATRRHLDPGRMRIVMVGDRAGLEPQLAPLGLGPVANFAADGRRPA